MVVRYAVHRRAGYHDEPLHAAFAGGFQQYAAAVDVGRENVSLGIQRQRGRCMDHVAHALHAARNRGFVPDVPLHRIHLAAFGIVELNQIKRTHVVRPFGEQMADHVDPQKSAAAGHQHLA